MLNSLIAMLAGQSVAAITRVPIRAYGLSGNGVYVYGCSLGESPVPCVWSKESGINELPGPAGKEPGVVEGACSDGSNFVGECRLSKHKYACVWIGGKIQLVAEMPSGPSRPAISADGTTVVGDGVFRLKNGRPFTSPFRWRLGSGVALLRPLAPGLEPCEALACSANGSLVVGYAEPRPTKGGKPMPAGVGGGGGMNTVGCTWDASGTLRTLPHPEDTELTEGYSCSDDGRVIAGTAGSCQPVVWVERAGWHLMPLQSFGHSTTGIQVSGDGSTVVGDVFARNETSTCYPAIWFDRSGNPQPFFRLLGYRRHAAPDHVVGISRDGCSVVLIGRNGSDSWLLTLRQPGRHGYSDSVNAIPTTSDRNVGDANLGRPSGAILARAG